MIDSKSAGVVIVVLGLGALVYRRATAAPAPAVDTRQDTSSFGPVEHVGPLGNTESPATQGPSSSTAGNQYGGITLPPLFGPDGCANRPLNDFHPDCLGDTWTAFIDGNQAYIPGAAEWIASGKAKRLTDDQKRRALLDPSKVWWGVDYRAIKVAA
jgi:hypothetical protein